jgi:hypothetical protein
MTDQPIETGDTPGVAAPSDEDRPGSLDLPDQGGEPDPDRESLDLTGPEGDRGPERLPRPDEPSAAPDGDADVGLDVVPLT